MPINVIVRLLLLGIVFSENRLVTLAQQAACTDIETFKKVITKPSLEFSTIDKVKLSAKDRFSRKFMQRQNTRITRLSYLLNIYCMARRP